VTPIPNQHPLPLRHEGVETIPIDEDIVTVIVWMSGPATEGDLIAYSRCAAAGYADEPGLRLCATCAHKCAG
jgi:hypothetical protein